MKQNKKTTVTLVTSTANPVAAIYIAWIQSRTSGPVPSITKVIGRMATDADFRKEVNDIFEKVIEMKMPLLETIDVMFLLENVPVALREQMVRHRIAHHFGERIGADIVPDLAGNSSFWSQTMRIIDCSKFFDEGNFFVPEIAEECTKTTFIAGKGIEYEKDSKEYYLECIQEIQNMYRNLMKQYGWPMEDARNVLPMALQHRLTWKTNLASLLHVLGKRTCWHAQLGMWKPVIEGMIDSLGKNVHKCFFKLLDPPCIGKDGNFAECVFKPENEGLMATPERPGGGNNPPCSLWVEHHGADVILGGKALVNFPDEETIELDLVGSKNFSRYEKWKEKFTQLWARDPLTGEKKVVG